MSRYKTPLRFPGGKQKLAPFIRELLAANDLVGGEYAEVYAGGGGIAIELLISGDASRIHLNDKDYAVYCFWRSVIDEPEEFCRRIRSASLTVREWRHQREILSRAAEFSRLDVGFSMFYLNRCNRSGILSAGVIGGLNQAGTWKIDARFSRNELIQRVEAIASRRNAITITNLDAERYLTSNVTRLPQCALVYCDPPYFHKAERLYMHYYQPADHTRIAAVMCRLTRHWLVSYDSAPEIKRAYRNRRQLEYGLQYNAASVYVGTEVLVFSPTLRLPHSSSLYTVDVALRRRRRRKTTM
jgi:DNA adenine methylase